jgi:solute carrier family 25, member 42
MITTPLAGTDVQLSKWQLLLSGAISGSLAKTVIAPMDRVKILFQTNPSRRFTYHAAMTLAGDIFRETGFLSFWRGHTATVVRIVPYSAINFFMYEHAFDRIRSSSLDQLPSTCLRFLAGAIAGSVAVCATYPLETLRARLAVDLRKEAATRGYVDAVKSIFRTDGGLSLYAGLRPTLIGIVPYAGTSFAVYETLRSPEMSFAGRLAAGGLAGVTAQAITYPLDVVRRRMQISPSTALTMTGTFRDILRHEGVAGGLFKGISMNFIKGPIAVAISMTVNDYVKMFFRDHS